MDGCKWVMWERFWIQTRWPPGGQGNYSFHGSQMIEYFRVAPKGSLKLTYCKISALLDGQGVQGWPTGAACKGAIFSVIFTKFMSM